MKPEEFSILLKLQWDALRVSFRGWIFIDTCSVNIFTEWLLNIPDSWLGTVPISEWGVRWVCFCVCVCVFSFYIMLF